MDRLKKDSPMETPNLSRETKSGAFSRFCQRLFSWQTARRALLGLAGFVTVIAVFYAEENWRGRRAWEQYKQTSGYQAEPSSLSALVPPPVPDDQNLAMAPVFADLFSD